MSGSKGGNPNWNPGAEANGIVFFIVLLVTALVLWHFFRAPIVYAGYGLDYGQYWLIKSAGFLTDKVGIGWMNWVKAVFDGRTKANDIVWQDMVDVQIDVGARMMWVYIAFAGALATVVAFNMRGNGFTAKYTLTGRLKQTVYGFCGWEGANGILKWMADSSPWLPPRWLFALLEKLKLVKSRKKWMTSGRSFMHFQAQHWKVTLVGAEFNPDARDAIEMPAKTVMEWLRDNGIAMTKRNGLDDEAAMKAFEAQLGTTWLGIEKAPVHLQAILVLSALNLNRDMDRLASIRAKLAELYVNGTNPAVEAKVRELIKPVLAQPKYRNFLNTRGSRHAYTNTAAIGIYGYCGPNKKFGGGRAGVFASADFRWLKKIDRTMWYCLNQVGRDAFMIEAGGAINHFYAERVGGAPLLQPMVDNALEGLETVIERSGVMDLQEFFHVVDEFAG